MASKFKKYFSTEVLVTDEAGLHARPAAVFVRKAMEFQSEIMVQKGDVCVDGKSIMNLMLLAAGVGTRLVIMARGADASAAVHQLSRLF